MMPIVGVFTKEILERAKKELAEEDFRKQVELAKKEIKLKQQGIISFFKKLLTTHRIIVRMERR